MNKLEVEKMIAECEKKAIPDKDIDFSEIPEVTDFKDFYFGNEKYFKPVKEQVSLRFNKILLDHFRAKGKSWQT